MRAYPHIIPKWKNITSLILDLFTSVLEDLNVKGNEISSIDRKVIRDFDISSKSFNKRVFKIDKLNLVDPLGIQFSNITHCFNLFQFDQLDYVEIVKRMKQYYREVRKEYLGEIWPLQKEDFDKPSTYYVYGMPWVQRDLYQRELGRENEDVRRGSHYWGPLSDREIENEARRFLKLYDSMLNKSQRPIVDKVKSAVLRKDRYISGFFLVHETGYRFMVLSGKHRSHVIQKTNIDKVWVRVDPRFYAVVSCDSEPQNTLEAIGFYVSGTTERIIHEIFTKRSS